MLDWIALGCLCGAFILLVALAVIDVKTRLLPNEMVAGFATLGIVFHLTTLATFVPLANIALGGMAGFGILYLIRAAANYAYQADALGLGDVKLMGAGGIWLGPDGILLAMTVGALAGLAHGAAVGCYQAYKTGNAPDFNRMEVPAGPGFAIGLIAAGIYQFRSFNPLI